MSPELSVLVVTCNRPEGLRRVLQDLAAQSLAPEQFEVLVSDDGSSLPAAGIATDFADRLALDVIRGPQRGPAAARNRALPGLRAPLTLLLNDDVWLEPDLLQSHLALHRLYGRRPTAVMGTFEFPPVLREQPLHRIVEDLGMIGTLQMQSGIPLPPQWFWTGNLSLPTEELLAVGGFDEAFAEPKGEDMELGFRLAAQRGVGLILSRRARAWHDHPHSLPQWWERARQVGRTLRMVAERHHTPELWPGGPGTMLDRQERVRVQRRTEAQEPVARLLSDRAAQILAGELPDERVTVPGLSRVFELPRDAELLLSVALAVATSYHHQSAFWEAAGL